MSFLSKILSLIADIDLQIDEMECALHFENVLRRSATKRRVH